MLLRGEPVLLTKTRVIHVSTHVKLSGKMEKRPILKEHTLGKLCAAMWSNLDSENESIGC